MDFIDLKKGFAINFDEKLNDLYGKFFKDPPIGRILFRSFPQELKTEFFKRDLRHFEIPEQDYNLSDVFEIFTRINRTGSRLKPQEIRNAFYHNYSLIRGAKKLASGNKVGKFLKDYAIVSATGIKRMEDTEFVLELLAYLISGIQDKKKTLDDIIEASSKFTQKQSKQKFARLKSNLTLIKKIVPSLKSTRLNKKSDFYSLFVAVNELRNDQYNIENKKYHLLCEVLLKALSNGIDKLRQQKREGRKIKIKDAALEDYFNSTQHSTDTKKHRMIRTNYIKQLLSSVLGKKDKQRLFTSEQKRLLWNSSANRKCALCDKLIETWDELEIDHKKPWALGNPTLLKNGQIAHASCNRSKGKRRNMGKTRSKKRC